MKLFNLSDGELVCRFRELILKERELLVQELEYIAELDRRKLFFHHASLRAYLVAEFGIEEWSAERKIRAARMLRKFPQLKEKLESGKLNLTLLEMAQGCGHREKLKEPEFLELIETISGKSCRAAQREIASRFPESVELPRDQIRPITAELSEVTFVAIQELLGQLEEIRGLLAHSHPKASLGELIAHLATEYRRRHHPEEKAQRAKEREIKLLTKELDSPTAPWVSAAKRSPSQPIIHALTQRDGYCCSYIDPVTQKKCDSQFGLQIDHVQPWYYGGETKLSELRYLCKNHHRRVSFLQFGESSRYFKNPRGH